MSTGADRDPCPPCRAGFPNECWYTWVDEEWTSCGEIKFTATGELKDERVSASSEDDQDRDSGYIADGYGAAKDISEYKDPLSTGRKRAATMYPIAAGQVCEWANLKRAGGGVVPIVGCLGRPASDRHHGPDKNTMNNAADNVHRICDYCHNTWHALNDPHYGDRPDHTQPFIPIGEIGVDWFAHDAITKATVEEILEAETKRLHEQQSAARETTPRRL
jgi:hypothetical protein